MSRFDWYDDYDEYTEGRANLWQANVKRALKGKRGQKALRELEAALLALPSKRLIEGNVCDAGEVCALGAMAWHRKVKAGFDPIESLALVEQEAAQLGGDTDLGSIDLGTRMGLSLVLANEIAYQNDEIFGAIAPEYRYERLLEWVRAHLE